MPLGYPPRRLHGAYRGDQILGPQSAGQHERQAILLGVPGELPVEGASVAAGLSVHFGIQQYRAHRAAIVGDRGDIVRGGDGDGFDRR